MKSERERVVDLLQNKSKFALIAHMLADGDSIGSVLGLGLALKLAGKEVKMYNPGPVPLKYRFLEGAADILEDRFEAPEEAVVIVLDSSDPERLGVLKDKVMASKFIVNIDHHVTNQRFGHLNLVDAEAAATGEIVFNLLEEAGLKINHAVAEALYVAITTDTGSFKYENTTEKTHQVAARLLEQGLRPAAIAQRVFDERPLAFYLLLRDAISSLELYSENRLAVMTLSSDLRLRNGALSEDLEGIVNYSRNIEGVELGVLFYDDQGLEVKVGFRSKNLDVSVLAAKFGGGGHARAAGCRVKGEFEKVKESVVEEAIKMLEAGPVK